MKLRIQGNTVRLRLTKSEVDAFGETGRVEETIRFRPSERLMYVLDATDGVSTLTVRYEEGRMTVSVPAALGKAWADTDQVGMTGTQHVEDDLVLEILIEKDFQCLHKPEAEKTTDAFPHPLADQDMP